MREDLKKVIVFGEVLFDLFPDRKCLGGAPFNFATHLGRFGVPTHFISRVGNDATGNEILEFARKNQFPTEGIQVDKEHSTGEVKIRFSKDGGHDFEILTHRAWDFIEWKQDFEKILDGGVSLIYFGTLVQRGQVSRTTIHTLLQKTSGEIPVFLDLNLRSPFYDSAILNQSLQYCDFLKVNEEEMVQIDKMFGWNGSANLQRIANEILSRFDVEILCVTKGEGGSELYRKGHHTPLIQKSYPMDVFQDSVGAGDAFASRFAYGLLHQWPDDRLLREASIFASRICTVAGAIPEGINLYKITD